MGWSSGSNLMDELIDSFETAFENCDIPKDRVAQFWALAIKDFRNQDWDEPEECLGQNELWDKGYDLVEQENKSN